MIIVSAWPNTYNMRVWELKKHKFLTLVNYLMDPKHIFTSELAKNSTKLAYNLSHDYELAQKRFEEVSLEKLMLGLSFWQFVIV